MTLFGLNRPFLRWPSVLLISGTLMLFSRPGSPTMSDETTSPGRETPSQLLRILHQPAPPPSEVAARDELARRQAVAAVALLKLGQSAPVWPLLRQSSDNSRRTYLVTELSRQGIDPALLIKRLAVEPDVSARRVLILSLGGFDGEQLPQETRDSVVTKLLSWYRADPDPGIHSAIDWLLRYGKQGETLRKLDWGQARALAAIDLELAGRPGGRRGWYITRSGQTMTVLRGPMDLRMGSPAYEEGRIPASDSPDEPLRRVRIPRSLAIANREVTVGQFRRFLDANPDVLRRFAYAGNPDRMARVLQTFSPEDGDPQIAVTWYEAAAYCNWLSGQESIPQSEWVYPANLEELKDGMTLPKGYLHKSGYRLPTEAEWEYAARAGSTTSRFYGTSDSVLGEYAWFSKNPPRGKSDPVDPSDPQHTWPGGQLKPNDFGLFDVYGNVWEWCQDRMQLRAPADTVSEDREDEVRQVFDREARSRRGGGFSYEASAQRSADRDTKNAFPALRRDNVGFRVVRTLR